MTQDYHDKIRNIQKVTKYPDSAIIDIMQNCTHVSEEQEYAEKYGMPWMYVRRIRLRKEPRTLKINAKINETAYPKTLWD